jgi:biopolymer transport protein ExbD
MKIALSTIALITGLSFCSAFAADRKSPYITITAPKDTPCASLTKVLDACKAAKLVNVTLRTTIDADTKAGGITLTVSEDISHGIVVKIIDACKAAGLKELSLKTTPSKETIK